MGKWKKNKIKQQKKTLLQAPLVMVTLNDSESSSVLV